MSTNKPKHICFSITHHGFGHGAISCAVIAQLKALAPTTKITILSTIPSSYFAARLAQPYDLIAMGSDFGMVMHSAISVDVPSSETKYMQLLQEWPSKVTAEQALLAKLQPDLVVSNISPITLAAAANLGIPSISVCPFNWSQILARYSHDSLLTLELIPLMNAAYASVTMALKPRPHVPNHQCLKEIEIEWNESKISLNDYDGEDIHSIIEEILTQKIGEAGKKILIPRGSRLYGIYSTEIKFNQARVNINWTNLLRPDGVKLAVTLQAGDEFGRAGVVGEVDRRYSAIVANTVLTSAFALGTSMGMQKLFGGGGGATTTVTNLTSGTASTTSGAYSQIAFEVTKNILDIMKGIVDQAIDTKPVIRLAQGTKITIMVTSDLKLPEMKQR